MLKRIGITGGIGSGKTVVTDFLREKGYEVIDADEIAREAAAVGEPALAQLREEIGDAVFTGDGELDRQALANLMFYDPIVLTTVNGIFHGDIKARIERRLGAYEQAADGTERPVFIAVPLLFESDATWMVDEVWLVTADDDLRARRAALRSGASEEDVRARMRSQMPEDEKRARADVVIENNGSLAELYETLAELLRDGDVE